MYQKSRQDREIVLTGGARSAGIDRDSRAVSFMFTIVCKSASGRFCVVHFSAPAPVLNLTEATGFFGFLRTTNSSIWVWRLVSLNAAIKSWTMTVRTASASTSNATKEPPRNAQRGVMESMNKTISRWKVDGREQLSVKQTRSFR